jgi:hypothetical protein
MENINLSILGDRHTIIIFPTIPTPSSTIIGISFSIGIGIAATIISGLDHILLFYHLHHNPSTTPLSAGHHFFAYRSKLH